MINSEIETSDRHLPGASSSSGEVQDCVALFCTTLENLNKIYSEQVRVLIKIAISVVEAAITLSSKPDERVKSTAAPTDDELGALVEQLRSKADPSIQDNISRPADMTADVHNALNPEIFCAQVQTALIVAIQNSVKQQDKYAETGFAILTMGVAKLLSLPLGPRLDST